MSQQYTPNLGQIPDNSAKRDAIHVAVIPVKASCFLQPGQRVGKHNTEFGDFGLCNEEEQIGVVDPFYKGEVRPGQMFWLCLFPGTITSLRHVWSHPSFKAKIPEV